MSRTRKRSENSPREMVPERSWGNGNGASVASQLLARQLRPWMLPKRRMTSCSPWPTLKNFLQQIPCPAATRNWSCAKMVPLFRCLFWSTSEYADLFQDFPGFSHALTFKKHLLRHIAGLIWKPGFWPTRVLQQRWHQKDLWAGTAGIPRCCVNRLVDICADQRTWQHSKAVTRLHQEAPLGSLTFQAYLSITMFDHFCRYYIFLDP